MSESSNDVSSNWAITDKKFVNICFTWEIKSVAVESSRKMYSPEFPDDKSDSTWQLKLYPFGRTEPDYLAVFLGCKNSSRAEVKAKFRLSLLDGEGGIAHQTNWSQLLKFSKGFSRWGREKFVKREKLSESGDLTIHCEIMIDDGVQTSSSQSVLKANFENSTMLLSNDLNHLWKTGKFSDVTLLVRGKKIRAHKFLLSARSPYFRNSFEKKRKGKNLSLKIDEFCYEVMMEVLNYIYSGKIENLHLEAISYLPAAEKFGLKDLKLICENVLLCRLCISNASSLLSVADANNAEKLKSTCMKFIKAHASEIAITPGFKNLKNSSLNSTLYLEISSSFSLEQNSLANSFCSPVQSSKANKSLISKFEVSSFSLSPIPILSSKSNPNFSLDRSQSSSLLNPERTSSSELSISSSSSLSSELSSSSSLSSSSKLSSSSSLLSSSELSSSSSLLSSSELSSLSE